MLYKLEWATRALAQHADVQISLYPNFVETADELALAWEEAVEYLSGNKISLTTEQREMIDNLDAFIGSISGEANAHMWTNQALYSAPEWMQIRQNSHKLIDLMGWLHSSPGPSVDIFIKE